MYLGRRPALVWQPFIHPLCSSPAQFSSGWPTQIEPSLRGTHLDTVQQRLGALRQRPWPLTAEESRDELALSASARVADVHLPLTHDPDAIQQRWDAVEASLIRSGTWTPLAIL